MSLRPTARARRIAEPGLLAAMAAIVHLADFFLSGGMLGAVLCPLPHAVTTLRHGLRAGLLGALTAVATLLLIGGPTEAAWHLFLFVVPGLSAGAAMAAPRPGGRTLAAGTFACGFSAAATTYVLEELMGLGEGLALLFETAASAMGYSALLFRGVGTPPRAFDYVPGLASPAVREADFAVLMSAPVGVFLALGFLLFVTTWLLCAMAVSRIPGVLDGAEATAISPPPVVLAPRLPRAVAAVFLLSYWPAPAAPPAWEVVRVNLQALLGLPTYIAGYLNLLPMGRFNPLWALFALAASLPFYYLAIWVGLLSSLRPPVDTQSDAPPPSPGPAGPRPGLGAGHRL